MRQYISILLAVIALCLGSDGLAHSAFDGSAGLKAINSQPFSSGKRYDADSRLTGKSRAWLEYDVDGNRKASYAGGAQRPSGLHDRSIHRILNRLPGYSGNFVDIIAYEVYDAKSWNEFSHGVAKVELYTGLLQDSKINPDPNRDQWRAGNSYRMTVPVFPVPGQPNVYAQVYPSFAGVIAYKLYRVDNEPEWRTIPVPAVVPQELRRQVNQPTMAREWRYNPQLSYNVAKYTAVVGAAVITGHALGQAAIRAQLIPLLRF